MAIMYVIHACIIIIIILAATTKSENANVCTSVPMCDVLPSTAEKEMLNLFMSHILQHLLVLHNNLRLVSRFKKNISA